MTTVMNAGHQTSIPCQPPLSTVTFGSACRGLRYYDPRADSKSSSPASPVRSIQSIGVNSLATAVTGRQVNCWCPTLHTVPALQIVDIYWPDTCPACGERLEYVRRCTCGRIIGGVGSIGNVVLGLHGSSDRRFSSEPRVGFQCTGRRITGRGFDPVGSQGLTRTGFYIPTGSSGRRLEGGKKS